MNITGKTMIFRKDFDGRPSYSRSISSKGIDGNWIACYEVGIREEGIHTLEHLTQKTCTENRLNGMGGLI